MRGCVRNAYGPMRKDNLFSLSFFWLAWELQWSALLGAGMQGQIARFFPPTSLGTATAVLGGSGALVSILAQYGAGSLSDRFGQHKWFIAVGVLANIAGLFCFALAPSFFGVLVAFAAIQIAFNAAGGPYQALMPLRVPIGTRSRASAYMGLFRLAGSAAGLLLARAFVRQPGPLVSDAAFEAGLLRLAIALACVLLIAVAVTLFGVSGDVHREVLPEQGEPWLARTSFTWLVVSRSLVSMGLYLILPFFAFYLRFAQHEAAYLASSVNLLLVMTVCALVGTVPAGIAGDRIAKKKLLYAALALLAAGAATLSVVRSHEALVPLAVLLGVGWGAYYSVDWALACVLLPPGRAGALMAIWNIGASGPQVAAPIVGGLFVDRIGAVSGDLALGYRGLFAIIACFVVLGGFALAFVRERWAGLPAEGG
jgi:MFS family permease